MQCMWHYVRNPLEALAVLDNSHCRISFADTVTHAKDPKDLQISLRGPSDSAL